MIIDWSLILEVVTAAAAAFIAYRQHGIIKNSVIQSHIQPEAVGTIPSPAAPEIEKIFINNKGQQLPMNVKGQLIVNQNTGQAFDLTKYGAGATLDLDTGEITFNIKK